MSERSGNTVSATQLVVLVLLAPITSVVKLYWSHLHCTKGLPVLQTSILTAWYESKRTQRGEGGNSFECVDCRTLTPTFLNWYQLDPVDFPEEIRMLIAQWRSYSFNSEKAAIEYQSILVPICFTRTHQSHHNISPFSRHWRFLMWENPLHRIRWVRLRQWRPTSYKHYKEIVRRLTRPSAANIYWMHQCSNYKSWRFYKFI